MKSMMCTNGGVLYTNPYGGWMAGDLSTIKRLTFDRWRGQTMQKGFGSNMDAVCPTAFIVNEREEP